MNEQTTIDEHAVETPVKTKANIPALIAGGRPRPIVPSDMDQVWRFATIVSKSGMAPKGMEKPEMITVAILHGLEVGLTPLMALQRIAVINGRPSIWGDAAMALVRASGLCEYVYEAIAGDGERMTAICRVKRKGEKEQIERTFSVPDAKVAGLWGKTGPWTQYPKRMLQMRARAFALRDLFADVLGGLYIAEELEEGEVRPSRDITPRETRPPESTALPPPVREQPQQDEPTQEVVQAEPAPETKRPLPPLAKTKTATVNQDGLDIPPGLDRRKNGHKRAQWLADLEGALAGCEDATAIVETQMRVMVPEEEGAGPVDWAEGERLVKLAVARVNSTIIDAG